MAGGEIVSRNYAGALFELAETKGQFEEFGEAMRDISQLLDEVPQLRTFLDTPRIERSEKKKVLRDALGDRVPTEVLNFVQLVVDRRRQGLLREMNREYQALLDEHLGRTHVEVSVAREIDDSTLSRVTEKLGEILGREVIPHLRIAPELLGGIVFRSGDVVFDGSVRRRLERMKRQLFAADVSTN